MAKVLYLPSTPLNVFVSIVLANHFRDRDEAEIWLVDQKEVESNLYYNELINWRQSPFSKVKIFPAQKGLLKPFFRKQLFQKLEVVGQSFQPDIIAVGSDRRIEFQFLMATLGQRGTSLKGWYLDDGLYSYIGRESSLIKDGISAFLKRIFYGFWWQEPKTVGVSSWVDTCWLFKPELAFKLFEQKQLKKVEQPWITKPEVKAFCRLINQSFGVAPKDLSDINFLVLIPHPANQAKVKNYQKEISFTIARLKEKGKVAVKYHPRQLSENVIDEETMQDVTVVPKSLALEFVLPLLPNGLAVLGDIGTSLLTSKWFREDIKVYSMIENDNNGQKNLLALHEQLNIRNIESVSKLLLEEQGV